MPITDKRPLKVFPSIAKHSGQRLCHAHTIPKTFVFLCGKNARTQTSPQSVPLPRPYHPLVGRGYPFWAQAVTLSARCTAQFERIISA